MTNVNQNTAAPVAIRNIAAMSDEHLAKVLRDHGISVPDQVTRSQLVSLARESKLWGHNGNIMPKKFREAYAQNGGNNGDTVAIALKGLEESDLSTVAVVNDIDYGRWSHCNFGQRRMNLSNVLRGKIRRGESVIIGLHEWDKGQLISQPEPETVPEVKAEPQQEIVEEPVTGEPAVETVDEESTTD